MEENPFRSANKQLESIKCPNVKGIKLENIG